MASTDGGVVDAAQLVRFAFYPFLPEVRQAVRELGPDLQDLLASPLHAAVRTRACERIEGALGEGIPNVLVVDERTALQELLSVPVARMLCVALAEKQLTTRYAVAEARRAHDALAADDDPEALARAAAAVGLAIVEEPTAADDRGSVPSGRFRMHFADYLKAAPSEPSWKLVLRTVDKGQVKVDRKDAIRLVQEALTRRIVEDLEAERGKPMPGPVQDALEPLVERVTPKLDAARESWTTGDFGPVQPQLFPPCVKEVFEALKRRENVPHHGRFALATFLNTIGWGSEQILDYLSATPNFDRDKSRYQIEHVTGQKGVGAYTPPGCATMQTNGVCPLDKRDSVCFTIKHPLSYYRKGLRRQQWQADRDAARAAAATTTEPQMTQIPQSNQTSASSARSAVSSGAKP
ncbi:MAG TPA: DNA primase large subunit PriL [Candidatus Thermoplasmatota archaeon]|nr:DNA primase large subunit PriL [Candidatus Thermoplasmatota archaeon]